MSEQTPTPEAAPKTPSVRDEIDAHIERRRREAYYNDLLGENPEDQRIQEVADYLGHQKLLEARAESFDTYEHDLIASAHEEALADNEAFDDPRLKQLRAVAKEVAELRSHQVTASDNEAELQEQLGYKEERFQELFDRYEAAGIEHALLEKVLDSAFTEVETSHVSQERANPAEAATTGAEAVASPEGPEGPSAPVESTADPVVEQTSAPEVKNEIVQFREEVIGGWEPGKTVAFEYNGTLETDWTINNVFIDSELRRTIELIKQDPDADDGGYLPRQSVTEQALYAMQQRGSQEQEGVPTEKEEVAAEASPEAVGLDEETNAQEGQESGEDSSEKAEEQEGLKKRLLGFLGGDFKNAYRPMFWSARWKTSSFMQRNIDTEHDSEATQDEKRKATRRKLMLGVGGVAALGLLLVLTRDSGGIDASAIADSVGTPDINPDLAEAVKQSNSGINPENVDFTQEASVPELDPNFSVEDGEGGISLFESIGLNEAQWNEVSGELQQRFPTSFYNEGGEVRLTQSGQLPLEVQEFIKGRFGQ